VDHALPWGDRGFRGSGRPGRARPAATIESVAFVLLLLSIALALRGFLHGAASQRFINREFEYEQ
jgi:hypothetical protein